MTRATMLTLLGLAIGWAAMSGTALAQSGSNKPRGNTQFNNGGGRKPSVSPYLNLLQGQQSGITNYQSLVRPMVDQQTVNRQQGAAIRQLQKSAATTRPQSDSRGNQTLRGTGHQAVYQNYSHYFPNLGRR